MGDPSDGCQNSISERVIEEEVYIEQPEGFETHEKKSHVCRLKKALYGLKQALRAWYGWIDGYLKKMGFVKSYTVPNLYYLVVENEPLILVYMWMIPFWQDHLDSLRIARRI